MFTLFFDRILQFDVDLFYLLNVRVQNPVFDFLMPILTNLDYWRVPLAIMVVMLVIFGGKKGRIAVALLLVGIAISDQLCNSLIKPLVGRTRPCNTLESVHLLINCTRSFSFPSSHATNMFTGTVILSFLYPKLKIIFLSLATLVAYSRIYVGVHYPLDMLGGVLLGIASAFLIIISYKSLCRKYPKVNYKSDSATTRQEIS